MFSAKNVLIATSWKTSPRKLMLLTLWDYCFQDGKTKCYGNYLLHPYLGLDWEKNNAHWDTSQFSMNQ